MPKDRTAIGDAVGGAARKKLRSMNSPVIKVDVPDHVINSAYRANSGHCAVSDAVKLAAPWATHVASDLQSIRLTDPRKGLRYTYLTPRTAQLALIAYDQGKVPPPFEFSLRSGHVATSYKRTILPDGKEKNRAVHKLGRRRLQTNTKNPGDIPGTIGGKAGVMTPGPLSAGQANNVRYPGYRREFGMRAYTGSFKLEDLETVQVPVGAPSISSR